MTRIIAVLPCVMMGAVCITSIHAAENNMILSNVWINGVDRKTEILVIEDDQNRYVECDVLRQLSIKVELMEKNPQRSDYCSTVSSEVQSEYDQNAQAIKITFPANYFYSQNLGAENLAQPDKASFGAYINYDVFLDHTEDLREYSVLPEIGIFKDYWQFNQAFIAKRFEDKDLKENSMTRLNSTFSIDFPKHYTQLVVGDSTTVMNPFVSSMRYGGVSFGTNFTDRPDFVYWNAPTLRGSAALPSKVDLLINGISIYQQQVIPGDFVLQTGANIQQAGDAQLVVEDVLGNRTVQSFPLMINNRLLLPKLDEYNVTVGKLRYNYDTQNSDYREFFTNLYFRRGMTASTTLGFNAVYSDEIKNLGLMWTQGVAHFALVDLYLAGSDAFGEQGYSIGTSLSRTWNKFSAGTSVAYASEHYKMLGYSDNLSVPEFDILAYFNVYDWLGFSSLNFNYIQRTYSDNAEGFSADSQILSMGVNKTVNSNLSLGASYFKNFADVGGSSDDQGFYFSLNYNFGKGRSVYAAHSTEDFSRLQYAQSSVTENGLDYLLGANQRKGEMTYQAYGAYQTNYGEMTAQIQQSSDYDSKQFSYRGALVAMGGKMALTSYVDNAFALVKVANYPDVEVYRSLSPVGKTKKDGTFFVHNIVPYITYDLSFDQDQLSMDDKIDYSSKQMIALDKRGYVIDFPIYQTRPIVARLLNENGETFARSSEVYTDSNSSEYSPIDAEGKVYLYGLKSGTYPITVKTTGGRVCHSVLMIPSKDLEQFASKTIDLLCK